MPTQSHILHPHTHSHTSIAPNIKFYHVQTKYKIDFVHFTSRKKKNNK